MGHDVGLGDLGTGFQFQKGARGFTPLRIGLGHHGRGQHGGVAVEHVFHLDRRDVLAAGDDDVLAAVLDLDVAVGVLHGQVAAVEPAAGKGFLGGLGVLQVALHGDVAAEHDLAHGFAVHRHGLHGLGVQHAGVALQVVAHALARVEHRALADVQRVPGGVLGAHGGRTVNLGQAVDVGQVEPHLLHALDHRGRWRRAGHHALHAARHAGLQLGRRVDQQAVHDGRAAVVRDAVLADGVEDGLGLHAPQAHVDRRARRHRPGEAPAVAVEHGQRPQVDGVLGHVPLQHVADGVGGRAAVVVDHALGVAGGAAGVVERDGVPFVARVLPFEGRVALGHQGLVGEAADLLAFAVQRVLHIHHQQRRLRLAQRQRLLHDQGELGIDHDGPGLAVIQHEGHGLRVEPGVQRVQHRAGHGDAEVRLHHRRGVGQHHRHRVVPADAPALQRAGQPAATRVGVGPALAQLAVHDGQSVGVDLGRALDEGQRRHRGEVGRGARQVGVVDAAHGCLRWHGYGRKNSRIGLRQAFGNMSRLRTGHGAFTGPGHVPRRRRLDSPLPPPPRHGRGERAAGPFFKRCSWRPLPPPSCRPALWC